MARRVVVVTILAANRIVLRVLAGAVGVTRRRKLYATIEKRVSLCIHTVT